MSVLPSPFSRLASATVSGLVSTLAQTFAGAKTFTSALIASAGVQLAALWNSNGTGASDVCVKVGTSVADGSMNAGAKLLSVRTGIGGTEVEKVWVTKAGTIRSANGQFYGDSAVNGYLWISDSIGASALNYTSQRLIITSGGVVVDDNTTGIAAWKVNGSNGLCSRSGTDSSGTPGNATINKPTGVSAIASGATTVVITNSLVTATSRVLVTWHGDHGAARWWVTRAAGSFTVTLSAAAGANTAFSWEVSSLL